MFLKFSKAIVLVLEADIGIDNILFAISRWFLQLSSVFYLVPRQFSFVGLRPDSISTFFPGFYQRQKPNAVRSHKVIPSEQWVYR